MVQNTKAVLAERKRLKRQGSKYVIQSVHADGFTYWFAGTAKQKMYAAEVTGVKWSAYWEEAIRFGKESIAKEAIRFYGLEQSEVLIDAKADYHLAFDLTPARLALYMQYELNQRKEFEAGIKDSNQLGNG